MIDGWPEVWEQELITYLPTRGCTTIAARDGRFNLGFIGASYDRNRWVSGSARMKGGLSVDQAKG